FFENLQEECLSKADMGFVALAEGQGRAVAAAVFLRLGRQAVYKFGASDERNWDCRPNQFVMWEAIRHLAESGAKSLHFGRTTPGQEGLLRYKRSWGAVESPIHYLRWRRKTGLWQSVVPESSPGISLSSRLRSAFFRSLPAPLTRLTGRVLYPHLD
ncbi:MAG: GNAT family N-acetyltransferase, partial [Verrucomicrobiaceae bacterium]